MKKRMITLLLALTLLLSLAVPVFAEEPVYTTKETFVEAVRRHMIARETEFVVRFKPVGLSDEERHAFINQILELATQHDESCPQGGDYLLWHIGGGKIWYGADWETYPQDEPVWDENDHIWIYAYRFVIPYYTTAAQEADVDEFVASHKITDPRKSDYDKVRIIYDWLCENVRYDHERAGDNTYLLKQTAYAAAIDKTAVCQGYASLFYRLALESGVNARLVTGKSYDANNMLVGHAWNIVYLAGHAYLLDATWDENVSPNARRFFLKGISAFDEKHFLHTTHEENSLEPAYDYGALGVSDVDLQRDRGDINGDNEVTITDVQSLYEYLATGTITGALAGDETAFLTVADVNYNGVVNVLDYQYLYTQYLSTLSQP